jgi:hypothetical protein
VKLSFGPSPLALNRTIQGCCCCNHAGRRHSHAHIAKRANDCTCEEPEQRTCDPERTLPGCLTSFYTIDPSVKSFGFSAMLIPLQRAMAALKRTNLRAAARTCEIHALLRSEHRRLRRALLLHRDIMAFNNAACIACDTHAATLRHYDTCKPHASHVYRYKVLTEQSHHRSLLPIIHDNSTRRFVCSIIQFINNSNNNKAVHAP